MELVSKISDLNLDSAEILTSYDVKSLFTNVPINLAIDVIEERWREFEMHTDIPNTKNNLPVSMKTTTNYHFWAQH